MFSWKQDKTSSLPIYKQIADYIAGQINENLLKPNDKLPSERVLSKMFNVSRNTISAATEYLFYKGIIYKKGNLGTYISGTQQTSNNITVPNWHQLSNRGRQKVYKDGFISSKNFTDDVLNLTRRHVYGDLNFGEYLFSHIKLEDIDAGKISSEHSCDWRGIPHLRESLSLHMKKFGINVSPEQILVCTSITQALNSIANIFLNVGIKYYHEHASFINLKNIMHSSGADFKPLEMDDDGIKIDKLKTLIHSPKNTFLHIHINNHNPTGITTGLERRLEIIKVCSKLRIPVIEMDSMRGMYYLKEDPPPLKYFDKTGSVIYLGSFLRPTSEMMGLAWIAADKYVIDCIARKKQPTDTYPNLIAQLIADTILRNGMFDEYMAILRSHLGKQLEALNDAMDKHIGDIAKWAHTRSSYYLWPEFEEDINIKKIYQARTDIDFNPGFFYDTDDKNHISITTLSMKREYFDEALKRLRKLIDTYHNTNRQKHR